MSVCVALGLKKQLTLTIQYTRLWKVFSKTKVWYHPLKYNIPRTPQLPAIEEFYFISAKHSLAVPEPLEDIITKDRVTEGLILFIYSRLATGSDESSVSRLDPWRADFNANVSIDWSTTHKEAWTQKASTNLKPVPYDWPMRTCVTPVRLNTVYITAEYLTCVSMGRGSRCTYYTLWLRVGWNETDLGRSDE